MDLSNNPEIKDFSGLTDLISLKKLILKNIGINDISILKNMKNLKELNLSHNNITQIPKINIPNLKCLDLNNNNLKSMQLLFQFPNLEYLNLNNNEIEELKCIDKMLRKLNKFYIDNNKLNLNRDLYNQLKITDSRVDSNLNNSRLFIIYLLLKNFFNSNKDQDYLEINFNDLIKNSSIIKRIKYPELRDILHLFKKEYEIRCGPNNIPISIVSPKVIASEIEEKILKLLVLGGRGYPLDDLVHEHQLCNKKAVKRLLRVIKDRELTEIPFLFTSAEIIRASYKQEQEKISIKENESTEILSYLLECFKPASVIQRRKGDPQIQQLTQFILGHISSDSGKKPRIVDIGAGYGDLIEAITYSGSSSRIVYIPIELDRKKWLTIEQRCKENKELEFHSPIDNIDNIKKADLIFFVNVFHELDLDQRVYYLHKAFNLTQKKGVIIIHEVVVLPKLEKNFLMWDKNDFRLIVSKIDANIDIQCSSTLTRPNGLPLHTIVIKYNDDNLISEKDIKFAIISSLKDIKENWLNKQIKRQEEPSKPINEEKERKFKAFLMAQNFNIDLWCEKYLKRESISEDNPKDMILKAKENARKEEEKNIKIEMEVGAKKVVFFRRAQIPEFEMDILKELEIQLGKFFSLNTTTKTDWDIKMGFSVENQRIIKIGIFHKKTSTLPKSIGNLSSLQVLELGYNKVMTLPKSIGNLKSLKTLGIYYNKLMTLPESIGDLKSLTYFDLRNNQLSTLPESIGNLSSLQTLHLVNNQLSTLPESIGNLTSLKKLDLSYNQLTTLPESIGNLSLLEELNLHKLKLTNLPESIGNLKSLKTLDLSFNQLTTLPESIWEIKSLQKLYLRNNRLTSLPESIGNLSLLEELNLKNNKLMTLPKAIKNLERHGVKIIK